MEPEFTVEDGMTITTINGVRGTFRKADYNLIKIMASRIPRGGIYVETGSYLGCSAVIVGINTKRDVKIFCHDIWEQDMKNLTIEGGPPPIVDDYFFKFYDNIRKCDFEGVVIPIRGDSKWSLNIHKDASIDAAFLDGDHSYDGLTNDLKIIWPKMKEGAYILCHDCEKGSETLKALEDFCGNHIKIVGFNVTNMKLIEKTHTSFRV